MSQTPVVVENFYKSYGSFQAVRGISFQLQQGEIFGLLGPNGAGKTTTLECLEAIRSPSAGKLEVLGMDPGRDASKLAHRIGVQLQSSGLHPNMTVEEAVKFFSAYHGVEARFDLVERLGLNDKRRTEYRNLSIGLQRRLNLALAIGHQPALVFLDEPTAGLDVASRAELHNIMDELRQAGTTILLATHDMAEAEKMADRVAILLHGKIAALGTPRQLTASSTGYTKVSVFSEKELLKTNQPDLPGVMQRQIKDDYVVFFCNDPGKTVAAIINYLEGLGDALVDLRVERPSLEERFLEITDSGGVQ